MLLFFFWFFFFFFQAEDGIRDAQESRGLGDVYKRQDLVAHARFGGPAPQGCQRVRAGIDDGDLVAQLSQRDGESPGAAAGIQHDEWSVGGSAVELGLQRCPHHRGAHRDAVPRRGTIRHGGLLAGAAAVRRRVPEQGRRTDTAAEAPRTPTGPPDPPDPYRQPNEAAAGTGGLVDRGPWAGGSAAGRSSAPGAARTGCLLYTSDAADEEDSV